MKIENHMSDNDIANALIEEHIRAVMFGYREPNKTNFNFAVDDCIYRLRMLMIQQQLNLTRMHNVAAIIGAVLGDAE